MGGWSREAQARKLEEVNADQAQAASERQAAAVAGVARSTLRHWRERQEQVDLAPEAVAFFESPVGVELLHRIVMAAQVVITLLGGGGIRLVGLDHRLVQRPGRAGVPPACARNGRPGYCKVRCAWDVRAPG